jgi:hypothetical protein
MNYERMSTSVALTVEITDEKRERKIWGLVEDRLVAYNLNHNQCSHNIKTHHPCHFQLRMFRFVLHEGNGSF